MDTMAIIKIILTIIMVYYLLNIIKYINGLKEQCKNKTIIDNIMVTYSKVTITIIIFILLFSFYLINIVVGNRLIGVFK